MAQTMNTFNLLALVSLLLSSLCVTTRMDPYRFDYSMKNVPIPSEKEFKLEFLHSVHTFSTRMQWRAFHFLNPNQTKNRKETFGLNTSKAPPPIKELKALQDGLCDIAKNIKFKKVNDQFQNKLKDDLNNIRREEKVIIAADKTRNFYKTDKEKYNEYLNNNITRDYKKTEKKVIDDITKDDKKIAAKLEIDDRLHCTRKRDSFITVKDHKQQFLNNPKFRLINPTKSELGMVSKKMLDKIIETVKSKSHLLQWKNSDSVIQWFSSLQNKRRLHFIQFDVINFYASISPDLLENSLTFAARYIPISEEDKNTIRQAAKSFLVSNSHSWIKKNGGIFDVTMGGFHGAEICDLVGLFLLSQLKDIIPISSIGLYRDDGLAVSSATPRQIDIMKKKICQVFARNNLQITIEANCKVVNFLDITLDLTTGVYKPYIKDNDTPVYVNNNSNHPKTVLKNIPLGVNRRLSKISISKEVFDAAAPPYQEALRKSGYNHTLQFQSPDQLRTKKKNRKKNVTWFNPPYCIYVKPELALKCFFEILSLSEISCRH